MKQTYLLKNLCCANCAAKIEDRIRQLDDVNSANFTLATQQLKVKSTATDVVELQGRIQNICDAVEEGVLVELYKRESKSDHGHGYNHDSSWGSLLIIAVGVLFMGFEVLSTFVPAIGLSESIERPLYIGAYVLLAFPILRLAGRNILKGEVFDENFLMSIATVGAIAIDALPEAVGVILFYRIGEYFEHRATEQSRSEIMNAVDMRPQEVRIVESDGTISVVNPELVEVGKIIEVRPGDLIPLDGTVLEGSTRINTAPVTGEPVPIRAEAGTELLSGCINENGRIIMRVDKALSESMVMKILDAVENATASKPSIDRFITRFARIYTPIVVGLAVAVAIIPALVTGDWHKWIYTALTFLVISCPCALVLSVPLAFFSGIGAASKRGILLKGGRVIEALGKIKAVALDKTGTITSGEFKVVAVSTVNAHVNTEHILAAAASVEMSSTHPIAVSIVDESKRHGLIQVMATDIQEIAGEGIVGHFEGEQVLVGNQRLMARYNVVMGTATNELLEYGTEVLVAMGGTFIGHIGIADTPRSDSAKAISILNKSGIETIMLTGEAQSSANFIGKATGIRQVRAQLLPQDKLTVLQEVRATYGPTLFVGDGINDAPVLAGADVGAAMGQGADAAIEAADVVFMRPSLTAITDVLQLSKETVRVSWQNVTFAIAVKIIIMVLGLVGYASMWWAVFGDTGVSILCILNSMRILYLGNSESEA